MKIYLASSWRNAQYPEVLRLLREAGHEVYDFRNPAPGNSGFSWKQVYEKPTEKWEPGEYLNALKHPIAEQGFKFDMDALRAADACVLLLPCGRSAHLEAGFAARDLIAGLHILLDDFSIPTPNHNFKGFCETCGEVTIQNVYGTFQCHEHARRAAAREPELMYKMAEGVHDTVEKLLWTLGTITIVEAWPMDRPELKKRVNVTNDLDGDLTIAADYFCHKYARMGEGDIAFIETDKLDKDRVWRVEALCVGYLTGIVTREEAEKEIEEGGR